MASVRVGARALALEAGLRWFGRIPRMTQERRQVVSQYLLDLNAELSSLSRKDLAILDAVIKSGSIRAAAELLAPGRPGYRSYVQRRFKHFEQLMDRIEERAAFFNGPNAGRGGERPCV
jgi:hypothetical protein